MSPKRCIVIVDPYSSGALLTSALVERGVPCAAVQSSTATPEAMKSRFDPQLFDHLILHQNDFEDTLAQVKMLQPTHVIAGFESGVELAEQLSNHLGLASNEVTRSLARRDKWAMGEAVRESGLRAAKQFCSNDIDALIAWRADTLAWPVVAKPRKSAASDHVRCCRTNDELRQAAQCILQSPNVFGDRNASVLVQECLTGPEYALDTVSYAGKHKLTAVWRYLRSDNRATMPASSCRFVSYDAMRLLPYQGETQDALVDYTLQVLDAVGVRIGPAHTEIILTSTGPVLVEIGARMSAGNNAVLSRQCGGTCQLDETVRCILDPEGFLQAIDQPSTLQKFAANVFLFPAQQGRLVRICHQDQLRGLPTLESMSIVDQPGQVVGEVAGRLTLMDTQWDQIERDIDTIRSLEREGIFVVES